MKDSVGFVRNQRALETALVIGALAAGLVLRIRSLDARAFWVDEAESSINALTILEHGFPSDSYLGLPIYENSFVVPWPGNAEYAWCDVSYSDRHFAVYHGWLPLYSIAASFALQNVRPAKLTAARLVQYDLAERKRRTRAARLPAVVFSMIFLLMLFVGGIVLYGRDAAWAALITGVLHPYSIEIARQARYYSAQVALTTACCVALWLIAKKCRWRDIVFAALSFILLFHTHLVGFATASVVYVLAMPFIFRRHPDAFRKLSVFAAMVAIGSVPWLVLTGFLSNRGRIPRAWPYLKLPQDFWAYPPFHQNGPLFGALLAILFAGLLIFKRRLSGRIIAAGMHLRGPATFLCTWAICGYAIFLLSIPLASFDRARLNLSYWGPELLLAAIICATFTRMLAARYSSLLAPAILLLLFFHTGHELANAGSASGQSWDMSTGVLTSLASLHLDQNTRLYSAPNDQLILTFYSGLPIQEILSVRRSFLDSYPGTVIYIDTDIAVDTGILRPENIRRVARKYHECLSLSQAQQWAETLRTYDYKTETLHWSEPALPAFACALLNEQHRRLPVTFEHSPLELMTRGFRIRSWSDWRNALRYRFLDLQAYSGTHANYAARLSHATVTLVPKSDTAIYQSPPLDAH